MSRHDKFLVAVMHGVLIAITVAVMLVTFFVTFPALETRHWPVVGKMRINSVELASEDRSVVYATFTKLRNCEYIGITWFHAGALGELNRVPVELYRQANDISSPNRPVGTQSAGPWVVGIPPNELRSRSCVQLAHRCHPFWTTFTNFYP